MLKNHMIGQATCQSRVISLAASINSRSKIVAGVVRIKGKNKVIIAWVGQDGIYHPAFPTTDFPLIEEHPALKAWDVASPEEMQQIISGEILTYYEPANLHFQPDMLGVRY